MENYDVTILHRWDTRPNLAPSILNAGYNNLLLFYIIITHSIKTKTNKSLPRYKLKSHLPKDIEADSVPVNTKKQTSWGLKKFTQWLEKRKIICDLHIVSPAELNGILRIFAEVKTNKKTDLTPSALTGIRAAIHRIITGQPFQGQ